LKKRRRKEKRKREEEKRRRVLLKASVKAGWDGWMVKGRDARNVLGGIWGVQRCAAFGWVGG